MTLLIFFLAFGVFMTAILNILPTGSLPTEISDSFTTIVSYMKAWDFILPFSTLIDAILVIIVVDSAVITWKIVKWLISIVRGNATS